MDRLEQNTDIILIESLLDAEENEPAKKLLYEFIKGNPAQVDEILSEMRHLIYKLGLKGTASEIKEKADFEQKTNPLLVNYLKQLEPTELLRISKTIRSVMALKVFSEMSEEAREKHLGMIKAKYLPPNQNLLHSKYLNNTGDLIKCINQDTPIFDLLSIIQACENSEDEELQSIRKDAIEFLVRRLISRHPNLIQTATNFLQTRHFEAILKQMPDTLSDGAIGGKAGGTILGYAILEKEDPEFDKIFAETHGLSIQELKKNLYEKNKLVQNNSVFLGSDIFRQFIANNEKLAITSQLKGFYDNNLDDKVQRKKELHAKIENGFESANFPAHLQRQLRNLFIALHTSKKPIIIRSSSELEDRKGAAFAGKYVSINLANQGEFEEDFTKFIDAIKTVYKSVFSPEVMEYRKKKGLLRDDEEMGILIQDINGQKHGDYFFPTFSAVAMSYATQSFGEAPEKGAASLALGLGDQVVDDTGRFIMFAKPNATGITDSYNQAHVVVMNLTTNTKEKLSPYKLFKAIPEKEKKQILAYSSSGGGSSSISLDNLIKSSKVPLFLEYIVQKLKHNLGYDVDCEFTIDYLGSGQFEVKLVQQRPQNIPTNLTPSKMPENVLNENVLVEQEGSVTSGNIININYAVYIDPKVMENKNFSLTTGIGWKIQEWIEKINSKMEEKDYFIFTPKRWGSEYPGPGIPARFNHFSNAAGFTEMFEGDYQPSFGTHFFQDVMDAEMVTGNIENHNNPKSLNKTFFENMPNSLEQFLGEKIPEEIKNNIKLINLNEIKDKEARPMKMHVAANNLQINGDSPKLQIYLAPENKQVPIPLKKSVNA
jgi:hypothetical protein